MTDKELRELDAFCAEHVMGWKRTENPDAWTDTDETLFWHRVERSEKVPRQKAVVVVGRAYQPRGQAKFDHSWETFSPTTDPTAAFAVLEKCVERAYASQQVISIRQFDEGFVVAKSDTYERLSADGKTLPLAIALFAKQLFSK